MKTTALDYHGNKITVDWSDIKKGCYLEYKENSLLLTCVGDTDEENHKEVTLVIDGKKFHTKVKS